MRPVEAIVAASVRRPWATLAIAALLTILGAVVTIDRFAIDTDTARLISPEVEWRRLEIELDRKFPQRTELLVVVVDGPTPEAAEDGADRLVEALRAEPRLFRSAERPDGGPFFARNGLLFLPLEDLRRTLGALVRQAPLLSIMSSDPSLRGFARTIQATLLGLRSGQATLDDLAGRFDLLSGVLERAVRGEPARLSWRGLLDDAEPSPSERRRLVLVRPVIDYGALQPGAVATEALRESARRLGLTPASGYAVRVTGPVALADEEFATVAENMALNVGLTLLAVILILYAALRSPKLVVAVLLTLGAGLVVTSALGLLLVGRLNLISVAFFVLFIGLGVDFAIQFAVRYRTDRRAIDDVPGALVEAARRIGFPLTLAALSLVAGFLSLTPTAFAGVSELGLIAGLGMAVACAASFTLLPALIATLRPGTERAPVETAPLAAVDRWIARRRPLVLGLTALVVAAGLPALLALRFDSDPMNLRDARVESVAAFRDLSADARTSPNALDVLAPSLAAAAPLAARLAALPEVARVTTLSSFTPADQDAKIAAVRAAAPDLAAVLAAPVGPPATDAESAEALRVAAANLRRAAGDGAAAGAASAARLAAAAEALAAAPPAARDRARAAALPDFLRLVEGLRLSLAPEPVTIESLPADIRAAWVAADGTARIDVAPKAPPGDRAANDRFVAAVRAIAPNATGAPVTIVESGRTIVRAFLEAGLYALLAITAILWIAMRRLVDVALALGPLVLAGIVTLEAAHLLGLTLNFANIIALPLMFGVGVAFHIYYLLAWRAGTADVLASSLTRAIFFSALTTGVAFGSLWASSHPGTASMGALLALSLVFTLLAAFIVVPAFLGPPPTPEEAPPRPASDAAGERSLPS